MSKDEVCVELIVVQEKERIGCPNNSDCTTHAENEEVAYYPFKFLEEKDTRMFFSCQYTAQQSGKFNYGIRVYPFHPQIDNIKDLNLVYWG
jgi:hypothetical protein